jgi:hypothetical protein
MINFSEVEKSVKELKKQLSAGEIDEQTLEDLLLDMIDVAEDGYYWMLGHESERWYRHDGEKWIPDDPGEIFVPLSEVDSAGVSALSSDVAPGQSLKAKWRSIKLGWFIISLIIMALIGAIVYSSAI